MAPTRTPPAPELPDRRTLDRLKISPEVAWYLITRGYPLPDCPPYIKTPEPRTLRGARFDPDRVDTVIRSLNLLRHTQGRWAGLPLRPDPWQVAYILAPVYGWVRRDRATKTWVRIIRTEYVDIPRKNGKTTLAGGQAIYLTGADGEAGAQVLAVAAAKDQAAYCFTPVKMLAEKAPDIAPHFRSLASKIIHKLSGSYFTVVASVADLLHGANIHGAVIDELHVHKTRDVVDAIESGTGSRQQPLVVIITTTDDSRTDTIYAEKRLYCEQLARRVFVDPTFYGVVFAAAGSERELADMGLGPFDEEAQRRANPGFGVSPTREFLKSEADKARQSPANLARYLRLYLGIRTKQAVRYITLANWDGSAGMRPDEEALRGRACHGGLDLSSVEDLSALAWHFPPESDDETGEHQVIWRFWLPEDRLRDLSKRTAGQADVWVREGWLNLTPGNVIDNDAIFDQIDRDAQQFSVVSVGYDRWGATDLVRRLGEHGLTCVGVGQGFASTAAPTKEILRLCLTEQYRHGGNPVMRWMVDNLAVRMDPAGNVKPDKEKSADKIDGFAAAVNALKEYLDHQAEEIVLEGRLMGGGESPA